METATQPNVTATNQPLDLLTIKQTAAYLNKSEPTLAKWRWLGTGPRYVKIGRSVYYRARDLERFIDANVCEPVAERGAA